MERPCPESFPPPPVAERASAPSPFRIDEGFSEDTRSQNGSPLLDSMVIERTDPVSGEITSARQWLLAQPTGLRSEIARELLVSLPNALVSEIVREANDRLHFDPVLCLPQEIILEIYEYLDPSALLNASLVSKTWRDRAFEPRLWRRLFTLEGWTYHREQLRSFEDNARLQIAGIWSNPRIRPRPEDWTPEQLELKKPRQHDPGDDLAKTSRLWVERGSLDLPTAWTGHEENDTPNVTRQDYEMHAIPNVSTPDGSMLDSCKSGAYSNSITEQTVCPLLKPSHLLDTMSEVPRPNWQWIYKQRRRLEQNWNSGRFTNFRLPHPQHPSEAHTQCVYTLQFSSKYVVSGSRDKSIRVWDLETQRLKLPPLLGHRGSVLCLQFDERAGHDIVISGGSDSDVIVWQLSTGVMVRRLSRAHAESVLNLRFDDRYLVTCSKDKTIKLWNRKHLRPSDPEYAFRTMSTDARYPDYIISLQESLQKPNLDLEEPLSPFTLLLTFEGHNAAVNAIQIFENHVVSASGDRKIILWDIQTGCLIRQFGGHSKGIACVQYDGRRIVSGSSDNTVRIFDSATAAEVASLEGHRSLVRTVQAEFGDMFDAESTLDAEARENDRRILDSKSRTPQATETSSKRHFVFGAKLPPGGGGNRWSKIVSGSYDETVMIWRRDKEGEWKVARELRQEDAVRTSAGPATTTRQTRAAVSQNQTIPPVQPPLPNPAPAMSTTYAPQAQPPIPRNALSAGMATYLYQQRLRQRSLYPPQPRTLFAAGSSQASPISMSPLTGGNNASMLSPAPTLAFPPPPTPLPQSIHQTPSSADQQPNNPTLHTPAHFNPQNPYFWYQQPPINFPPGLRNAPAPVQPPLPPDRDNREEANVSRLFKLQFDSRRIISSSQLPVIVGWDFANGDKDIIEASQFFGEPV